MKLRLADGEIITIMPVPKRKRRVKDDEFKPALDRWLYLSLSERKALLARMQTYHPNHWARREYFPWAAANLTLWTLPCEGVTLLPHSKEEEAALRAYWDGWMEQSEKVWSLQRKWPSLTREERAGALVLAELMAADLPIAHDVRDWMKAHMEDELPPVPPGNRD